MRCSTPPLGGNDDCGGGRIAEKIGPCLRKSMLGLGFSPKLSPPAPLFPLGATKDEAPPIRWRKGELIGCGASGHVYLGMNLDSGELLAVKQVFTGASNVSKEKAQAHKLEEEVKLLKNLSHPNIVRYLGTVREKETLNILLEFVPGGSISSLLGKFGPFPEAVIKMYTKQLLQGLEYLHKNGIMHRDIKGANILVDNKGCIKLADFGASKQVANLVTMTDAKSMIGTPYWMAPEVIRHNEHTFSADIWSVGCTVIEMATGKPPWSEQYEEVAALLHIGTTESHPPIPKHLSSEAKKFLLKCLQKKPGQRPSASDLLQHSFVTKDFHRSSAMDFSRSMVSPFNSYMKDLTNSSFSDVDGGYGDYPEQLSDLKPLWDTKTSDDMCQIFDKSFNPMSESFGEWPSNFDANSKHVRTFSNNFGEPSKLVNEFTFPSEPTYEDDDEVTESKIRAFLDEKAFDLKKLQTPIYEFINSLSAIPTAFDDMIVRNEYVSSDTELPTKISKPFPSKIASHSSTTNDDNATAGSSRVSNTGLESNPVLLESPSGQLNELKGLLPDSQPEANNPRHKKWKEELDQELDRERGILQACGVVTFSPLHRCASRKQDRKQDRMLFMSPGK